MRPGSEGVFEEEPPLLPPLATPLMFANRDLCPTEMSQEHS